MFRRVSIGLLTLFAAFLAVAEPVSLDQARTAVRNWVTRGGTLGTPRRASVSDARTCSTTNGASFHVVTLEGGGFVVTSADTEIEPVIAFSSDDGAFVADDRNPLWTLLCRDLAGRSAALPFGGGATLQSASATPSAAAAKWASLLSTGASLMSVSSISDVRVAPFMQSKWNQGNAGGGYCYNYYTPNHYVCGCVATSGAQIMRYFEWPRSTVSVAKYTCDYCMVGTEQTSLTTQGGTFDWSLMPLVPTSSNLSEAGRAAIGKLTSDIGIICGMQYTASGSGAGGYMLLNAFSQFGYSNAMAAQWDQGVDKSGSDEMLNALLSNFDARLPVELAIYGSSGGHSIVGDGYGYSSDTLYIHLNMGWSGTANAWYAPPALDAGGYSFSSLDGFVYNIYTNQTAGAVVCSGRVLDASGTPVSGSVVTAQQNGNTKATATTDAKGIYALILPAGTYTLTATQGETLVGSTSLTLSKCVSIKLATGSNYGAYYFSPEPSVGNRWGVDVTLQKIKTIGEVLGTQGVMWSTDGWIEDTLAEKTMKAPSLFGTYTSVLEAVTEGRGTLIFTLTGVSSSEKNGVTFTQNGNDIYSFVGEKGFWFFYSEKSATQTITNVVTATGMTTHRWTYTVGNSDRNPSSSGAWLTNVQWIPHFDPGTVIRLR